MTPNISLLPTNFDFCLPRGLVDVSGEVHRKGVMRLATGRDELAVTKDRRVYQNEAYGMLVMLAQVITHLGKLEVVTPEVLESLFTQDLAYLRELYNRINQQGSSKIATTCPQCNNRFDVELVLAGE